MERLRHRPRTGRRLLLYGGIVFVLIGGAAAVLLNRPARRPSGPALPVILTGQVVSQAPGVHVDGLRVVLQPSRSAQGRRAGRGDGQADPSGLFRIRGDYRGLADVFIRRERWDPWISRPVRNISVPTTEPISIVVIQGTSVRGRLVREGIPVTNTHVDLYLVDVNSPLLDALGVSNDQVKDTNIGPGHGPYNYWRISIRPTGLANVDSRGDFVFRNLPEDAEFWLHSQVGNLPDQGTFSPRKVRTGADRTAVHLGDVQVRRGHRLAGRVVFSDGEAPPSDVGVQVTQPYPASGVWSRLDERGRFEINGLVGGRVRVEVAFADGPFQRTGFRLSSRNQCLDPRSPWELVGRLDHDVNDLTILFEEGDRPEPTHDPATLAAFEGASAGPITGVPPEAVGKTK